MSNGLFQEMPEMREVYDLYGRWSEWQNGYQIKIHVMIVRLTGR